MARRIGPAAGVTLGTDGNMTVVVRGSNSVESVVNGVTRTRGTIGHAGAGQLDFGSVEIVLVQNGLQRGCSEQQLR